MKLLKLILGLTLFVLMLPGAAAGFLFRALAAGFGAGGDAAENFAAWLLR